jgi:hypothetical protein
MADGDSPQEILHKARRLRMATLAALENPTALIREARQLRADAGEVEERAIRLALEQVGWIEMRAAALLDKMPRTTLRIDLLPWNCISAVARRSPLRSRFLCLSDLRCRRQGCS